MTNLLFVAPYDDVHARVVADHVGSRADVQYIDLHAAVTKPLYIGPGEHVTSAGMRVAVSGTTVWWRRTGFVPPDDRTSNAENRLRAEEARAQLVGGLLSLEVTWVDHPGVVETAEHTLLQLATARRAGAVTPATVVTSDPDVARAWRDQYSLIAKSISSGLGIAPYADHVDDDILDLVPNAPTLLQEHITGTADFRVVVVADRAYVWRRAKVPGEPFDWRNPDPSGAGFEFVGDPGVGALAIDITRRMGLTYSAQDWVETPTGPVFLESNPVGQWLFLPGSANVVGPALADHLLAHGSS
ncbi:hypothetical protein EUA06_21470 [Nocardioides glacieisoli]|uniref:ATP-grasp domain-containing protein n=1 Tax=Nocardioides glacieisoli TaxID=1168730 RepID=A0A4Q2RJ54_9ACTN|nr:hypothetical protein [Nocardioides glacieisoli]RYB88328.1 hypothetical protein EUA06_21470 [Nocardioides glacieisoli]